VVHLSVEGTYGSIDELPMFYLGWFACVMGAGVGTLVGSVRGAALVLIHLYLAPRPVQETRMILLTGILGFAVDTLQASAACTRSPAPVPRSAAQPGRPAVAKPEPITPEGDKPMSTVRSAS